MWLAEAHSREAWNHTAGLMAMIANCHRDPKKGRAYRATFFHPFARRQDKGLLVTKENIGLMKEAFLNSGFKKRNKPQEKDGAR